EAFYYFAWRTCEAMSEIRLSFDAPGVRKARNHLIEHPTKAGGSLVSYWVYDCPQGLILKAGPVATGGSNSRNVVRKPVEDPGLYPNAREFVDKLLPKIERALV